MFTLPTETAFQSLPTETAFQSLPVTARTVLRHLEQQGRSTHSDLRYLLFLMQHLPAEAQRLGLPALQEQPTSRDVDFHLGVLDAWRFNHGLREPITLPLKDALHLAGHIRTLPGNPHPLEGVQHTTGLSHLGFLVENTCGQHLVLPFQHDAVVLRAELSHPARSVQQFFQQLPYRHRPGVRFSRSVVDVHALGDILKVESPVPHLHLLASAHHSDTVHLPIHESLREDGEKVTYHLILRTVKVQGRHNSPKLHATSTTNKIYVVYHKEKRKLYRVDSSGVRDFSYRDPFHDLQHIMDLRHQDAFEMRLRSLLLEDTPFEDQQVLLQLVHLPDLIKVATTPALALHAEVTLHHAEVTRDGKVTLSANLTLPGKFLKWGFRKNNQGFFKTVFPGMDRRVKRQITCENYHLLATVADLTRDPDVALALLHSPGVVHPLDTSTLARLLSSRSSTVRKVNRRRMGQALLRSVRKKGLLETWQELRDTERMLREVVKKDRKYTLPPGFDAITRLHDMVMRDYNRLALEGLKKRVFKVRKDALLHFEQVVTVGDRTVHFRVVRDNHELLHVGRSMNICVGSYTPQVLGGDNLIVVGCIEDIPRFCVQVKPTWVNQFKLSHNRHPKGEDREVAVKYLDLIGMVDLHDVQHTPKELFYPAGFLQRKPFSEEVRAQQTLPFALPYPELLEDLPF